MKQISNKEETLPENVETPTIPYIKKIRNPKKILQFKPSIFRKLDQVDRPTVEQVQLQLTDVCNIDCYFCSYSDLRIKDRMPFEMVQRALDMFDPCLVILTGGGEPTIYRYENSGFADVVREIGNKKIGLITNGTVMPREVDWDNFEWVRVSVDTNSKEQYEKMKSRDFFDKVIENVERYCRSSVQNVGIGMLLDRDVLEELPESLQRYFTMWKEYPKLNVQIRTMRDCQGKIPSEEALCRQMKLIESREDNDFSNFLRDATNFYEWVEQTQSTLVSDEQRNTALRCYMSLLEVVIRPNGDIYPCDNTPQRDPSKLIGNLSEDPTTLAQRQRNLYRTVVPSKCFPCRYNPMNLLLEETLCGSDRSAEKPFI